MISLKKIKILSPMKNIQSICSSFKPLLFWSIALLALSACEDVIDVDLDQGATLLVVDAWITNEADTACKVRLSTTAPYFNNQPAPVVSGAVVEVSDNEGNREILTEASPGFYISKTLQGKVGNQYTLKVLSGEDEYRAETQIKPAPQIDSLRYEFLEETVNQDEGVYIYYYGPELPTEGDFYRFKIYQNDKLLNKPNNLIFSSDEFVNGNYIGNVEMNSSDPLKINDKVKVELLSLTEDAYYFYLELALQVNNGGIFANPPANVRTNVRNISNPNKKAVGYFGGSAVSALEGVLVGEKGMIK
jgi:hypothetical protein